MKKNEGAKKKIKKQKQKKRFADLKKNNPEKNYLIFFRFLNQSKV